MTSPADNTEVNPWPEKPRTGCLSCLGCLGWFFVLYAFAAAAGWVLHDRYLPNGTKIQVPYTSDQFWGFFALGVTFYVVAKQTKKRVMREWENGQKASPPLVSSSENDDGPVRPNDRKRDAKRGSYWRWAIPVVGLLGLLFLLNYRSDDGRDPGRHKAADLLREFGCKDARGTDECFDADVKAGQGAHVFTFETYLWTRQNIPDFDGSSNLTGHAGPAW